MVDFGNQTPVPPQRVSEQDHVNTYGSTNIAMLEPVLDLGVFLASLAVFLGISFSILESFGSVSLRVIAALAATGIVTVLYRRWIGKKRKVKSLAQAAENLSNREAETQKQIDQMHADNSRIPKVTK